MQRPFTAVRSVGLDLELVADRCLAYAPLLRPGEAFSHRTAAALYGVPLPHSRDARIHVASPPGVSRSRTAGVVGHESAHAFPVRFVDGHPVVDPERAWCQLASMLAHADLVAAADALVTGPRLGGGRRGRPHASIEGLEAAVRAWGGRRGARALARALPRVRVGADSRPESLLRLLVVDAGLPEPLIGHPIEVDGGMTLHPDLVWPRWRVVLEYEGDGHRVDRDRWRRDIRRREALEAAGWRVIRVTADDLFGEPGQLISRVRAVIALATRRVG